MEYHAQHVYALSATLRQDLLAELVLVERIRNKHLCEPLHSPIRYDGISALENTILGKGDLLRDPQPAPVALHFLGKMQPRIEKDLAHSTALYELGFQPFYGEILINSLRDKPIGINRISILIADERLGRYSSSAVLGHCARLSHPS